MKTSTKRSMKIVAIVLSLVMVIGCGLAYFTDFADTSANGTAGTVDIALESYINLLDEDGKDILNPGDWRDVTFQINNIGNKSVDVRTTITLTSSVPMFTDENGQAQFELYVREDIDHIDGVGAQIKDGATPIEVRSISADGLTITYNIPDYILDGIANSTLLGIPLDGGDFEVEADALKTGDIKGVRPTGVDASSNAYYDFVLVFRGDSGNEYQGATVVLNILAEAKQHRNTSAGWELVAEENAIVPGNGYEDGMLGGAIDDEVFENAVFTMDRVGAKTGLDNVAILVATKDTAYVYEIDTGRFATAAVTSYSNNDGIITMSFATANHTYELTSDNTVPGTTIVCDGVEYVGDPNYGNGGGNESNDFEEYNSMMKEQDFNSVYADGTSYEVLYKVTESDGMYFIDARLYNGSTERFASEMWSDKSDVNNFVIGFGEVDFTYSDGMAIATYVGGGNGGESNGDQDLYDMLYKEGYSEVYNQDGISVLAWADEYKGGFAVYAFDMSSGTASLLDSGDAEIIDGYAVIYIKLGAVTYDNGTISVQ